MLKFGPTRIHAVKLYCHEAVGGALVIWQLLTFAQSCTDKNAASMRHINAD